MTDSRLGFLGAVGGVAAVCVMVLVPGLGARQASVQIDGDDIGGVVTGPNGPEAGVWVIAETTDLPTRFNRTVVTDDEGRYVVPDLPAATYAVWVRGYGLVDSPKQQASPGTRLDLTAVIAPDDRAAAQYYPAGYWYSLLEVPGPDEFPGTGPEGNGISPSVPSQAAWLRGLKSGGCTACHALGNKATREIPPQLGEFDSLVAAWDRRVQSGQAGRSMSGALDRMGRRRALEMYADWTGRIMAGEVPPAPPRPRGVERNVVITQWDWADPTAYLHDEASTDKRNPTVNANGPIYGALEASADYVPVLDPVRNAIRQVPVPVRDPDTPRAGGPNLAPSPYWGDEAIWDSQANVHNPMLDQDGRVWLTSRVRGPDNPPVCLEGSNHPSARAFPNARAGRHLAVYDPSTDEMTLIGTCYSTHHLIFAEDENNTIWTSGGGQVIGWLNTKLFLETGDEELAQGWSPLVLDTNGNGRRDDYVEPGEAIDPSKDARIRSGFYGVAANPNDGSIWGSSLGFPGALLRFDPGENPSVDRTDRDLRGAVGEPPGVGPGVFTPRDGHRPERCGLDPLVKRSSRQLRPPKVHRSAQRSGGHRSALPGRVDALRGAAAEDEGDHRVGQLRGELLHLGRPVRHVRLGSQRADQYGERVGGAARVEGRRVGHPACPVSARVLHQVDGRSDRRPWRRVEGQGPVGHLEHPGAVPRRNWQGHAKQGGQVSAAPGPTGQVTRRLGRGR